VAYSRLSHKGAAVPNTLGSQLLAGGTTINLSSNPSLSGWPPAGAPFFVVIDPGTAKEEKVCVVYASGTTLNVVDEEDITSPWGTSAAGRGVDDTIDREHDAGAVIYPVFTAREANQANELVSSYINNGDLVVHGDQSFKKIAVGTNAHVLQADSSITDGGVKWGQVSTAGITNGAVTADKIDAAVAGNGLAGGAGSALSVNVDGSTIEINADSLRVKDAGVVTAKIADDAVTSAKIAAPTLTPKTDTFTLALVDENCTMQCNKATAMNAEVPGSGVAFTNGAVVTLMQYGAGQVTVAPASGSGVTVRSSNGLKLRTQYSMATLVKISDTEWVLSGDTVV
jgi:hypothetical protein